MDADYRGQQETREWLDALAAVIDAEGKDRAHFLLDHLLEEARQHGVDRPFSANTAYVNTIEPADEAKSPGNLELEGRLRAYMRWNAMAMVVKANRLNPPTAAIWADTSVRSHRSRTCSARASTTSGMPTARDHGGDLLYIQGHSAPGIYARAFLEGRLTEEQLLNFRQEVGGKGLSSYPHPKLMPDFWQFPTVSMGLGPLMAIYQARFNKYLHNRGIKPTPQAQGLGLPRRRRDGRARVAGRHPLAAREKLDNLVFVVNCNLQRLDGPVRGNGKIIQELEGEFRGAGWNVIKLIWGSNWDPLLARDKDGALRKLMMETSTATTRPSRPTTAPSCASTSSAATRARWRWSSDMSDDDIWRLRRGGHDPPRCTPPSAAAT
jgi:pyruvate dehydrogenase E1 component